jgi:uncharacterized protein (DUF1778 family)
MMRARAILSQVNDSKTRQLQIRVSAEQKRVIKRRANQAGMDVSAWVLRQLVPSKRDRFLVITRELSRTDQPSYALASLSDFLAGLSPADIGAVLDERPDQAIPEPWLAYAAALIEERAVALATGVPAWVRETPPLAEPYFATGLAKLRLYLLTRSPPAFRRRNLFVDRGPGRV